MPPDVRRRDVDEVGHEVGKHVQSGLEAVAGFGLQDRGRDVGQVVDVLGQDRRILVEEAPGGAEQLVEVLQRRRHFAVGVGERVGELREVVVQRHELLIVLVQRVDEQCQALDHPEEVAAALVQRGECLGQAVERGVDLLALALEPVGERFDDIAEDALGLGGRRAQVGQDAIDRVAQFVVLDRDLGAVLRDDGVVLEYRASGVRRRELDGPRRDEARVEHRRRDVDGQLVLRVVVEGDPHLVAGRLHLVDRPDLDAHDLDLVTGVQRERLGELGHHGIGGQLPVQVPADERGDQPDDDDERSDDDRGAGQRRHLEIPDVEDGGHRLVPYPCDPGGRNGGLPGSGGVSAGGS